jgi:sugar phosphate isomerase/epimerase
MKFAFSSNAFLRHNLLDTIRIIAKAGYDGIEIMADVPHAYPRHLTDKDVAAIRSTLLENKIEISNINAFMHHADGDTYHPSWIEHDPSLRQKRLDYTLRCIDLAEELGAKCISTEPGGPLDGMTREKGLRLFKEGLLQLVDRAREKSIRILIEPEPGLLIENSMQFKDFYSELDRDIFGINFDIGHFFCVGEDPAELVKGMEGIPHFHLEDIAASREHHHLMLGEGAIDIPKVLTTIQRTGYNGFVTVELYTYESDAEGAARKAFDYLRGWREKNESTRHTLAGQFNS